MWLNLHYLWTSEENTVHLHSSIFFDVFYNLDFLLYAFFSSFFFSFLIFIPSSFFGSSNGRSWKQLEEIKKCSQKSPS